MLRPAVAPSQQGDKLVAHTETVPGTYLVDPQTLGTLGR